MKKCYRKWEKNNTIFNIIYNYLNYIECLFYYVSGDGSRVERIKGLREIHINGSLYFPPFSGERYRQDIHDATYQCKVTNTLGTILSRKVRIRAGNL